MHFAMDVICQLLWHIQTVIFFKPNQRTQHVFHWFDINYVVNTGYFPVSANKKFEDVENDDYNIQNSCLLVSNTRILGANIND